MARIGYDISEKKLFFRIKIHRLSELLDREFQHLLDGIAVDLPAIPVHRATV